MGKNVNYMLICFIKVGLKIWIPLHCSLNGSVPLSRKPFGRQTIWSTWVSHCHLTGMCFVDTHLVDNSSDRHGYATVIWLTCFVDTHLVDNSCDRHGYATVIWLAYVLLTHIWSTIHVIDMAMVEHLANTEDSVDRWLVDTAIRATTSFFRLTVCRPNVFRWNDMEPFE